MKQGFLATVVLALALGGAACRPAGDEVRELREQQKLILDRLAKLERGRQQLLAEARPAPRAPAEDFDRVYQIPVVDSPTRGNLNAPVTIVEFSDFQCPFCARSSPLIEEVLDKYGDKVRLVYKHFPLSIHPNARPAAIASMAAQEQGRFWEMHDVLFANSRDLGPEKLPEYARRAGLDVERFQQDLEKHGRAYDRRVSAEYKQGLEANVQGTPTIYVNGKKLRDRSLEGFSAVIDEALSGAEALRSGSLGSS